MSSSRQRRKSRAELSRAAQPGSPLQASNRSSIPPPQEESQDPRIRYGALPLRLFLGATFVYAGLQKLSDPGFLAPGSSTYIGSQLESYARISPIAFLIHWFALPLPRLTGVAVIAAELVIGAMVLAGVLTRRAAAAGAILNFVLFLTATWQVQPYFLGSDSIYTVAWITLALTGDRRIMTLQPALERPLRRGRPARRPSPDDISRRQLLLRLGGAGVAIVWALAVLPRAQAGRRLATVPRSQPSSSPPAPGGASPSPPASSAASGTQIGSLSQMRSNGGSLTFQDPQTGDPGVAVGLGGSRVVAFDAVCTHAGCTVEYDPQYRLLVCPCHGAVYDPARGAAVVQGPAPSPLAPLKVQLAPNGELYLET
ncbi:MAG: TQO small subunit DoxD [Candidatus Dormibacteraceae bacterium]